MAEIDLHIRERLPELKDRIDRLAAEDKEFSALCDDFDICVDALRYWASSEEAGVKTRVREYCDLIGTLYEEITQILKKSTGRRNE